MLHETSLPSYSFPNEARVCGSAVNSIIGGSNIFMHVREYSDNNTSEGSGYRVRCLCSSFQRSQSRFLVRESDYHVFGVDSELSLNAGGALKRAGALGLYCGGGLRDLQDENSELDLQERLGFASGFGVGFFPIFRSSSSIFAANSRSCRQRSLSTSFLADCDWSRMSCQIKVDFWNQRVIHRTEMTQR